MILLSPVFFPLPLLSSLFSFPPPLSFSLIVVPSFFRLLSSSSILLPHLTLPRASIIFSIHFLTLSASSFSPFLTFISACFLSPPFFAFTFVSLLTYLRLHTQSRDLLLLISVLPYLSAFLGIFFRLLLI